MRTKLLSLFLLLLTVHPALAAPEVTIEVLKKGEGPKIESGMVAVVSYKLTLDNDLIIENRSKRNPFRFVIGQDGIIPGFSQAVVGMQIGERRKVRIPPELGYGPIDQGVIPGDSFLNFEVELLQIKTDHDHDGDGVQDHTDDDHVDHDHDGDGQPDHSDAEHSNHDHDHGDHDGHDHNGDGIPDHEGNMSEKLRDVEYLNQRHAQDLVTPAMFEYLIRDFFTKPWRYEDGPVKILKATGKVMLAFLLIGLLGYWAYRRKLWTL